MRITLGKLKNKTIKTGKLPNTRPTMSIVKEGIFNMINVKNKDVLDIFAGTGQLGFEAISLEANKVVMVDKDKKVTHYMKETTKLLELDNVHIYNTDYRVALQRTKDKFDIIFVDPPYKDKIYYRNSFDLIIKRKLLKPGGLIISEIDKMKMPEEYYNKNFNLLKDKRYGNTNITILSKI